MRGLKMLVLALSCFSVSVWAADTPNAADQAKEKKALQEVGDFVGEWKGNAEGKTAGKNTLWKENYAFGWKFKDGHSWMSVGVDGGKYFKSGDLKYNLEKKLYTLEIKDKDDKPLSFTGELKKGRLVLERKDEKSGDIHRLNLNTAAEGVRLVFSYEVQTGGKGLFSTVYKVAANKEGESLAGGGKKNECVVTGGLGTMTVSYNGKTYYVCCSGCRDEFNANPKKYVDEFEKKNKK
jgi:ribosomal protein L24E